MIIGGHCLKFIAELWYQVYTMCLALLVVFVCSFSSLVRRKCNCICSVHCAYQVRHGCTHLNRYSDQAVVLCTRCSTYLCSVDERKKASEGEEWVREMEICKYAGSASMQTVDFHGVIQVGFIPWRERERERERERDVGGGGRDVGAQEII